MMSSTQKSYKRTDPFRPRRGNVRLLCIRPIGAPILTQSQNCVRSPCVWGAWGCCLGESKFQAVGNKPFGMERMEGLAPVCFSKYSPEVLSTSTFA
jgi:hypothetical protein